METIKIYGPLGTGKTERLTNLMLESLDGGYSPEDILFATYTRSGERAIKERLEQKGYDPKSFLYVGTFHKICSRLVGFKRENRFTTKEMGEFCGKFYYQYEAEEDDEARVFSNNKNALGEMKFANACMNMMSRCISRNVPLYLWPTCLTTHDGIVPFNKDTFERFVERLSTYKLENQKFNYDDILLHAKAMQCCPPTKIMLFDEFQDLYPLLVSIFEMWYSKPEGIDKVVIAGDPNQTIYRYMHANPQFMLDFKADRTDILFENHRCRERILRLALNVLDGASYYDTSKFCSDKPGGDISRITEWDFIPQIERLNNDTVEDVMILARTNYLVGKLYMDLYDRGIPIQMTDGGGLCSDTFRNVCNCMIRLGAKQPIPDKEMHAFITNIKAVKAMLRRGVKTEFIKREHIRLEDWTYPEATSLFQLSAPPPAAFLFNLFKFSQNQHKFFQRYLQTNTIIPKPKLFAGTFHSAKGMSAEAVVILNRLPKRVSQTWNRETEMDERRLLSMAVGRAKNKLLIVQSDNSRYPFLERLSL